MMNLPHGTTKIILCDSLVIAYHCIFGCFDFLQDTPTLSPQCWERCQHAPLDFECQTELHEKRISFHLREQPERMKKLWLISHYPLGPVSKCVLLFAEKAVSLLLKSSYIYELGIFLCDFVLRSSIDRYFVCWLEGSYSANFTP